MCIIGLMLRNSLKNKNTPERIEDAIQTVMMQCELWVHNTMEI